MKMGVCVGTFPDQIWHQKETRVFVVFTDEMASDYLLTDDLTILLSLIAATVFLLNNLYKPQPLVHPILLGRQSDVGRARNPGESAIYRNYATGLMGRVRISLHILFISHCFSLSVSTQTQ